MATDPPSQSEAGMFFNEPIHLPCDVCHERREEFYLVSNSKRAIVKDGVAEKSEPIYGAGITVRFCTDKEECGKGAAQLIKQHIAKEKANYARSGQD